MVRLVKSAPCGQPFEVGLEIGTSKVCAVVGEVSIPGMMGSMPMTYMVRGKQYLAFTVGTSTEPASVVGLALEK